VKIDTQLFLKGLETVHDHFGTRLSDDFIKGFETAVEYAESQLSERCCENCKHFSLNTKTPSKNYCDLLGVHNIGGCVDYWELKK
jgi:hypothetical protein